MIRQGDILFIPVEGDQVRGFSKEQRAYSDRWIVARGEKTGHAHVIQDPMGVAMLGTGTIKGIASRILRVAEPVSLAHDEHAPVLLQPGDYEVRQQREFTEQRIRAIED